MLSRGGRPPVEATVASAVVVAVLETDGAGPVGCTISDEAGRPAVDATTLKLGELLIVGWRMLSTGGRAPVEATVASLALVTVLDADELGAVGCTISEEGGRPPVEPTTVDAALAAVSDANELGAVGCTISEEGGRPPVDATTVDAAFATVLDADELEVVGCTISDDGGRPPVEATVAALALVTVLVGEELAAVGWTISEGGRPPVEPTKLDAAVVCSLLVVSVSTLEDEVEELERVGTVGETVTGGKPLDGTYGELDVVTWLLDDEGATTVLLLALYTGVELVVVAELVVAALDDVVGCTDGPK